MPLMPRPGSRVFPRNWDTHHRPVAESAMTDTVALLRPAPASAAPFDELTGESDYPDPAVLATTVARIQRLPRRGGAEEVGDRPVEIQLYQVSIPVATPEVRANDQVYVLVGRSDLQLANVRLRIREVLLGSQVWERDLICEVATPMTR